MALIDYIVNKNSIITSNVGGGSTSFTLYLLNNLCISNNVLYYSTGSNIDRSFVKNYYNNVYHECTFFIGPLDIFLSYLTNLGSKLENFNYIILDTADVIGKESLQSLKMLFDLYNINMIATSQLRVDPNNSRPYSTVEEWNKQLNGELFQNSIWIRNVNEPNTINKRKYIDIYNHFRIGNRYTKRYIISFDKKRGNVL